MTIEQVKENALGQWQSIAPEVRPSALKNPDGTLKPFYLSRKFTYLPGDEFELGIINYADANGKVPLVKLYLKGHAEWQAEHPIAAGAYKVDFTADEAYDVTPLHPGFLEVLNKLAVNNFDTWQLNATQSIFKKAFVPFGLGEGQIFKEYDMVYVYNDLLFWGARNIDGRGFDTPENRPTNLQIPMVRK